MPDGQRESDSCELASAAILWYSHHAPASLDVPAGWQKRASIEPTQAQQGQ